MKKLLSIILFTLTSNTFATTIINCPTSENYSFYGRQWSFQVQEEGRKQEGTYYNYGKDFYNYDPYLKKIDQHTSKTINGMLFSYTNFSTRAKKNPEDGTITLQCNGTYSANECPSNWWGDLLTGGCRNVKNDLKASLFLDHDYASCMPTSNTAFECI